MVGGRQEAGSLDDFQDRLETIETMYEEAQRYVSVLEDVFKMERTAGAIKGELEHYPDCVRQPLTTVPIIADGPLLPPRRPGASTRAETFAEYFHKEGVTEQSEYVSPMASELITEIGELQDALDDYEPENEATADDAESLRERISDLESRRFPRATIDGAKPDDGPRTLRNFFTDSVRYVRNSLC